MFVCFVCLFVGLLLLLLQNFIDQCKELDKSLVHFLKYRIDWHRLISQVEAKLQGKEQEREALETYVRTQPKLGIRNSNNNKKRKHEETIKTTK